MTDLIGGVVTGQLPLGPAIVGGVTVLHPGPVPLRSVWASAECSALLRLSLISLLLTGWID